MSSPTKADLTAAVAKLTEENAALRDLLGAISKCADAVPIGAPGVPDWKELHRATNMLRAVKIVADPAGSWAWGHANGSAAKFLLDEAAKPVGYVAYVAPADDEYRITPKGEAALDADPAARGDRDEATTAVTA